LLVSDEKALILQIHEEHISNDRLPAEIISSTMAKATDRGSVIKVKPTKSCQEGEEILSNKVASI